MGGRPIEALGLIALGFRQLSMTPSAIGPVKAMILATDLGASEEFLAGLLESHDATYSLRDKLLEFAEAQGIPV
jgi:phosphotransferase system enzyme I (PtsP)